MAEEKEEERGEDLPLLELIGHFIAHHPWKFIFFGVTLSLLLSSGLTRIRLETDIRKSFSPRHSDSSRELQAYLDFFNLTIFPQRTFVHFSAPAGGNLLDEDALQAIERVDKRITDRLSKRAVGGDGLRACDPLCNINAPYHFFVKELRAERRGENGDRFFSFPSSRFSGRPLFVASHFSQISINESSPRMRLARVSSVVLFYFARADNPKRFDDYKNMSLTMFRESSEENARPHVVRYDIFGDLIANHEMIRGALEATAMMSIGFGLLLTFVALVVIRDWPLRQVPFLTFSAVFTPLLATAAGFGVLCWLGFPAYSIQCVAPFLVLGIGVDDAFILFHTWQSDVAAGGGAREEDVGRRAGRVLGAMSASITITSATNIIAFAVGFFTPTPQMSLFCLATALALLFDFLLTFSFLVPVVSLLSSSSSSADYAKAPQEPTQNEKATLSPPPRPTRHSRAVAWYAGAVSRRGGQATCLAALIAILAFATVGVLRMNTSFEPAKAFPSDSPLAGSLQLIKPVFNDSFPLSIFVQRPPDIANKNQYTEFYKMVDELEAVEGVFDRERTLLFLKEYEQFDRGLNSMLRKLFFFAEDDMAEKPASYASLPHFLELLDNPITIQVDRDHNGTTKLRRFQMVIMSKGMSEWAKRAEMVESVRRILKSYPSFNATLFDGDSAILHLLLNVGTDLIGSILVTVLSMAIVCSFFVQSAHAVLIITSIIASICYCLVGVLSWWGADLDPVTQVDVLLATGFSVDYTAHIAFHFCKATGTAKERIRLALQEMSIPLVQAGISTLLCMLPLMFVRTYAILAFAKTVFAVVLLGLFHGLFILPALLSLLPPPPASLKIRRLNSRSFS